MTRDRKVLEADWTRPHFVSSTPAAGSPPTRSATTPGRCAKGHRPGRAGDARRRRRPPRRRRHRRDHRRGRAASPGSCSAATTRSSSSPTRSTTNDARADLWEFVRLGLGDPSPVSGDPRPAAAATCSTRSSPRCPPDADRRPARRATPRRSSRSRSSGGPTSASPRCSTGSSATSGRSSTTCPAPPATPSTPSSRPTTGRCGSSTPPGMRRKQPHRRGHRVLQPRARPRSDRPGRRRAARHRRHRGRDPPGPAARRARRRRRHRDRVVLNKWDLLDADADARRDVARPRSPTGSAFLGYAPVLKISALTGRSLAKLLPALREAETAYHRRVPTAALNRVVQDAQAAHPPPSVRKRRARVLYATQGAVDPPTVHPVHHRRAPAHLPALPRAQDPRGVPPRPHPAQAPGPPPRPLARRAETLPGSLTIARDVVGALPILAALCIPLRLFPR